MRSTDFGILNVFIKGFQTVYMNTRVARLELSLFYQYMNLLAELEDELFV